MKHNSIPDAVAIVRGGHDHPDLNGIIRFFQRRDGVIVEAELSGLPMTDSGFFGFHIHEGSSCGGVAFSDSGSHYDPVMTMHPKHAGDLPPLLSDHGKAYMKVFIDRFHISEVIGRTIIIHNGPDDLRTQPSGNAGTKIGCGSIRPVSVKGKKYSRGS